MATPTPITCTYCSWVMNGFLDHINQHACFDMYNAAEHAFFVDDDNKLCLVYGSQEDLKQVCSVDKQRIINTILSGLNNPKDAEGQSTHNNVPAASRTMFTSDQEELLITAVQERPALYDHRLPLQDRLKLKKKKLWEDINKHLGGNFGAEVLEKHWSYLRECYMKDCRRIKRGNEQRSGAATPKVLLPSFRHYSRMAFLKDIVTFKRTQTSLQPKNSCLDNDPSLLDKSIVDDSSDVTEYETEELERLAARSNSESITCTPASTSTCDTTTAAAATTVIVHPPPPSNNSVIKKAPASTGVESATLRQEHIRKKRKSAAELETEILHILKADTIPTKELDEIDGFFIRIKSSMKRLTPKVRRKFELELLTRLDELEDSQE